MFQYVFKKNWLQSAINQFLLIGLLFGIFCATLHAESFPGQPNSRLGVPPLVIGTLPFNPPFETSDTNRGVFLGFEIDIVNHICKQIGRECIFKAIPEYKEIFQALTDGHVDMAVASIVIIEGMENNIFSYPFLPSYVQFFAKKQSKIKTTAEIKGRKIGLINDPLLQVVMMQQFGNNPPFTVFPTVQAGIESLTQGGIDAMVLEAMSVDYWLSNTGGIFKKVGDPIPFGLGYGVMAMKNRLDLINQVNTAITSMESDGTYARIYDNYFTTSM